jgi:hypothetical protein
MIFLKACPGRVAGHAIKIKAGIATGNWKIY